MKPDLVMQPSQIFIVDDDPQVLEALARLFKTTNCEILCFSSGEDFLAAVSDDAQGCLILDVNLNGMNGLTVQTALAQRHIALKVVMISGQTDVPTAVKSVKLGAVEFIEKPFQPAELNSMIRQMIGEQTELSTSSALICPAIHSRFEKLTDRELIALKGIVRGLSNRELTELVGMSLRTVQFCRKNIFEKTGFKNRAELMNWIVMNSVDLASFRP